MNKDQKWNLVSLSISTLITAFATIVALLIIQKVDAARISILIAITVFIFVFLYAVIYIIPKAILRIINSKKKESKLVKIRHISEL